MKNTYKISVHEKEDPIRIEHGIQPGWILIEENLYLFELRKFIKDLRRDGYTDEGILIEKEDNKLINLTCDKTPQAGYCSVG